MSEVAPVWKFGEVNPETPEFKSLPTGESLTFMPLETIWPNEKADYTRRLGWTPKANYTQFRKGDILIPKITPTFEASRTIVANTNTTLGLASTEVHVVRPFTTTDPRFLQYCFQSSHFLSEGEHSLQGVGNLRRITPRFVQEHKVHDADLDTQRRIADYLDRETGQIDAMIAKLDELAEDLVERRSRVIQQNTINLPVPVTRIKLCASVSLGKTFQGQQKSSNESFTNYVRAASIQPHGLELDDQRMWMTEVELARYNLLADDVLIVEGGAGYGRSVVLDRDMPGWGFQNHVIRVRPNERSEGRFLNYCVKAHLDAGLIDILVDGATIPAISSDKARELPIPHADLDTQRRIADHLDEVTGRIDAMLGKVAELKDLLIERRAALITDVVTGRKEVA